ncbi:MAG: histidine kinase [Lachnospiraceae bacterium]|nr:histidine kinase [Lachnospiraceae bacterium]
MVTYVVVIFVPILILSTMLYGQIRSIMLEKDTDSIQNFVYEARSSMDNQLAIYNNLTNYVSYNQSISQVVSYDYQSTYEKYNQVVSVLDPLLAGLKYFHKDLKQVTIYMENEEIRHDTTLAPLEEIEGQEWYETVVGGGDIRWFVDRQEKQAFAARRMPTLDEYQLTGILYISVDYDTLFAPFENTMRSNYGIYVVDDRGDVIYEQNRFEEQYQEDYLTYEEYLEKRELQEKGTGDYVVVEALSEQTGWRIGLYMPNAQILSTVTPLVVTTIIIALTCIILLIVMQRMVHQVYDARLKQKAYEMKALQSQINPHFLYNSLSLINWKALEAEKEDISQITLALSKFYRTSLNKGKNTLRIAEEIENVKSYLHIQQVMHDDSFDVEYEFAPEILEYEVPNLILQPIVENAIEHGIELLEDRRGVLTISGYVEGKLVILSVKDNGVGMEPAKVDAVLTESSKGYGVRNVNERLKICYGPDYALQISSRIGQGTEVKIRIPIG